MATTWRSKLRQHTDLFDIFSDPGRTIHPDQSIDLDLICSYLFFRLHCDHFRVPNDRFCFSIFVTFAIKSSSILTRLGSERYPRWSIKFTTFTLLPLTHRIQKWPPPRSKPNKKIPKRNNYFVLFELVYDVVFVFLWRHVCISPWSRLTPRTVPWRLQS